MQSQYAYYDPRMQVANQMVIFVGDQGPQAMTLSQPIAQQYLNIPVVRAETLFVPTPQGVEVLQSPGGQPTGNQSGPMPGSVPSQGQSAYVQYPGQVQGQPQEQPLQPINSPAPPNVMYPPPQYAPRPQMMPQGQYVQLPNTVPTYQGYTQVQVETLDKSRQGNCVY
eukprot:TRINITY_DN3472_c0_g2_i3.p2 TRINITY_DN3472_c0_g2~~TRINITY_DN3472_c0_g2_i3.p2  ORF type:complete len:167 (+),score=15.38 TRINITY_DN3472_c0_g2_i3:137-637(+)